MLSNAYLSSPRLALERVRRQPHARGAAQVAERHRAERRDRGELEGLGEDVRARRRVAPLVDDLLDVVVRRRVRASAASLMTPTESPSLLGPIKSLVMILTPELALPSPPATPATPTPLFVVAATVPAQ